MNGVHEGWGGGVQMEEEMELHRGPWTVEEDFVLMNYIAAHGEGRWNSLARCAGLRRTGKSCRLRWLNYLRPDVRRGNITPEEQLLILELHSRWGNRWSKIAQELPGRTDNEIKNYWRTRVQKHAKQLQCDVNSKQFKDMMRYMWMPRLMERIQARTTSSTILVNNTTTTTTAVVDNQYQKPICMPMATASSSSSSSSSADSAATTITPLVPPPLHVAVAKTDVDTSWFGGLPELLPSPNPHPSCAYYNLDQIMVPADDQLLQQNIDGWGLMGTGDNTISDNFWDSDDIWLLQQQQHHI